MQTKAKCLCGSVNFEIELSTSEPEVAACHCSMCRKWLGGPMLAIDSGKLMNVSGESFITRYSSSEWAERGFCNKCGTKQVESDSRFCAKCGNPLQPPIES